jgi:Domain of unknown function (DUF4389)
MDDRTVDASAAQPGMSGGRIARLIAGSLLALIACAVALAGVGVLIANGVLRDGDGFFTTSTQRFATTGRALATKDLSVIDGIPLDLAANDFATVRLRVRSTDPNTPVFVGIARADDVATYLLGTSHGRVSSVDWDPFTVETVSQEGTRVPALPRTKTIWAAQASGTGAQSLRWNVRAGTWSVVVMNADASPGVSFDASVGAKIAHVVAIGLGLLIAGGVLLLGAVALIVSGAIRPKGAAPTEGHGLSDTPLHTTAVGDPVRFEGRMDGELSRWLWMVKWLLAFPHWLILAVLWLVFCVLSVVAFFAILFTGRYPRGIFNFNVGVLRWSWRVSFYTYSALGTDRYPPFSLADVPDYPARFDVRYPERLSRGLVLVKSWLLAIPHLIIVAVFTGTWSAGLPVFWGGVRQTWWGGAPGLIGILVLISAVGLLFTGTYPRSIFDLVVGLNRWVYRVAVYVGLMRDEYPVFRLDLGQYDPDGPLPPSPPVGAPPTSVTPPTIGSALP